MVQTMELLADCKTQTEKLTQHQEKWAQLQPSANGENTPEAQVQFQDPV